MNLTLATDRSMIPADGHNSHYLHAGLWLPKLSVTARVRWLISHSILDRSGQQANNSRDACKKLANQHVT